MDYSEYLPIKTQRDLTGQQFAQLTVIKLLGKKPNQAAAFWLCRCSCGKLTPIHGSGLYRGAIQSCGCLKSPNGVNTTRKNPLYRTWVTMRQRCSNPNDPNYKNYGGRGIKVCTRWDSFGYFFEDIGVRPGVGYSIDRIDSDGDYEPSNVRWATSKEQARNKKSLLRYSYQGRFLLICELAELPECVVIEKTLGKRLRQGWDIEKALQTPSRQHLPQSG